MAAVLEFLCVIAGMLIALVVGLLVDERIGIGIGLLIAFGLLIMHAGDRLLAIFCLPMRLFWLLVSFLVSAFFNLVTWIIRRWGGGFIQDMIFGVSGFPLPRRHTVTHKPDSIGLDFYEFRYLQDDVVQETLAHRSRGIGGALDVLTGILAQDVVLANDYSPFLREIGTNTTL